MADGKASQNTRISKLLSYVLRHGASELGLQVDAAGFVAVPELLAHPRFRGVSEEQLRAIVQDCPKQRFQLQQRAADQVLCVRANQGHSMEAIETEALLTPVTAADIPRLPVVVHGTNMAAWASIRRQGLSRMGRRQVHFATGLPGANGVISGMRASADVLCFLDVNKALQAGLKLYRSANNVILTEGDANGFVPMACISHVTARATSQVLFTNSS